MKNDKKQQPQPKEEAKEAKEAPQEEPKMKEQPKIELPDVQELDEKQITEALVEMAQNPYFWSALVRYNQHREVVILSGIRSVDPFKEPTTMARYQGALMGIKDLEDFVNLEIDKRNNPEKYKDDNIPSAPEAS